MRMLNVDTNEPVDCLTLYLTWAEAEELLGALKGIMKNPDEKQMQHSHVNDQDYAREVTVAIYTEKNLNQFDERSRRLIVEGT